jgi:hypothetical protein
VQKASAIELIYHDIVSAFGPIGPIAQGRPRRLFGIDAERRGGNGVGMAAIGLPSGLLINEPLGFLTSSILGGLGGLGGLTSVFGLLQQAPPPVIASNPSSLSSEKRSSWKACLLTCWTSIFSGLFMSGSFLSLLVKLLASRKDLSSVCHDARLAQTLTQDVYPVGKGSITQLGKELHRSQDGFQPPPSSTGSLPDTYEKRREKRHPVASLRKGKQ